MPGMQIGLQHYLLLITPFDWLATLHVTSTPYAPAAVTEGEASPEGGACRVITVPHWLEASPTAFFTTTWYS